MAKFHQFHISFAPGSISFIKDIQIEHLQDGAQESDDMANKRIYYAIKQVGMKVDGTNYTFAAGDECHGVQSAGISTNFNLTQVFELGQQALYELVEDIPDVEVTLNKVLDGYPLLYHQATKDNQAGNQTTSPSLAGRSTTKTIFGMAIFPDTNDSAANTPPSIVACSGMFVGSVGYNFPLEEPFNEDLTLVGNNKIWKGASDIETVGNPFNDGFKADSDSISFAGQFANNNDAPIGDGGVNRRENITFAFTGTDTDVNGAIADPDCTILPPDVFGISSSGTNNQPNGVDYECHLSNISVSVDFAREEINELGRRGPYSRSITFPVEVTCEIEVTSHSGDMVSATEIGIYSTGDGACNGEIGNLLNRTIRIATCEGTRIYLGTKNKLASVNHTGGDAGGGNVSVSYTFTNFNDFTVMHTGDPHPSGEGVTSAWWSDRATYLVG